MGTRGTYVEIRGIFYESLKCASKKVGCTPWIVKKRCLSNNWGDYKVVILKSTEKRCSKCKSIKLLKEFDKNKGNKDGLSYWCKKCKANFIVDNFERVQGQRAESYLRHKETRKKYIKENVEKIQTGMREYKKTHREEINTQRRERRRIDICFRLNDNISRAINSSLIGMKNGRHWEVLVGYTLEELMTHLEKQFTEGMTWENHGCGEDQWHIDHIIPISLWNITSAECQAFKNCWALDNLQPLWQLLNISKGNKIFYQYG